MTQLSRRFILGGLVAAPAAAVIPSPALALLDKPQVRTIWDMNEMRDIISRMERDIGDMMVAFGAFEFNDHLTRRYVRDAAAPYLAAAKQDAGLYQTRLVCDETCNPRSIIDQNDLIAELWVQFNPSGSSSCRSRISMVEATKRQIAEGTWN